MRKGQQPSKQPNIHMNWFKKVKLRERRDYLQMSRTAGDQENLLICFGIAAPETSKIGKVIEGS